MASPGQGGERAGAKRGRDIAVMGGGGLEPARPVSRIDGEDPVDADARGGMDGDLLSLAASHEAAPHG